MTRIHQVLSTMLFLAAVVSLNAQTFNNSLNQGYWTLGMNGGKAYQSSDVNSTANGLGLGLTVGKNIYHRPGSALDFGVQGRFSYTKSTGLNTFRNYNITNNDAVNGSGGLNYQSYPEELGINRGFIFSNHKTNTLEAAAEGVVTLNNLKEKTGVKLSFFGGLGANYFEVKTDQADGAGNEYFKKYAELNNSAPTSFVKKNLREAILDGDYESYADGFTDGAGKVKIMPSVGLEAGFQVTPKFSIDLGHRTTFSGTDLLDGEQWIDGNQDILHYTYVGTTFNFNKREKRFKAPVITVYQPHNASLSHYRTIPVRVKVENMESAAGIELLVNGKSQPFRFKKEKLSADVLLKEGENEVVITASSFGGEDKAIINVFFEKREEIILPPPPPVIDNPPVVYRPVVEFITPIHNHSRIREERIEVRALVRNILDKRDIVLYVNGREENFRFDTRREEVETRIYLLPGENEIILRAVNDAGRTEERMLIFFEERIPSPFVKISQPSRNFTTRSNKVKVVAETEFVAERRDVFVTVNGREVYDVEFGNHCITAFARLREGRNIIRIRVENPSGFTEDEVVVFHKIERPELNSPTVKIISPKDHENKPRGRVELIAEIFEVTRKRDIDLILNNNEIQTFDFRNNRLTAALDLEEGTNEIIVRASNRDGRDEQTVIVKFERRGANTTVPVVKIISPANKSTVYKSEIVLRAEVEHSRRVEIFVNNTKVKNVSIEKGSVKVAVKLTEGDNAIRVVAKNRRSASEKSIVVHFKKKHKEVTVIAPSINITQPTAGGSTSKQLVKLKANISGINTLKNVEVLLNGKKVTTVTLKGGKLTALLGLKKGKNTVKVKARNNGGSVVETLTVTYKDKVHSPVKKVQTVKVVPSSLVGTEPVDNEEKEIKTVKKGIQKPGNEKKGGRF